MEDVEYSSQLWGSNGNSVLGTSSSSYGASENGNGSGNGGNHGWQKVTYSKKKASQDAKPRDKAAAVSQSDGGKRSSSNGGEPGIFLALEKEADDRRLRREAKIAAAAARLSSDDDYDSDGADENHVEQPNGAAKEDAKKVKQKKPKKPKVTVVEAASAIDASDLAAFLVGISESFPTSPDVQLMRCADYFGRAFNSVESAQFGWNKILRESSIVKAIEVAVLMVLGLVLRRKPDALVQKASVLRSDPKYLSFEKLPMLAWTYGQVAQGDLVAGMYLWVQNLLPLSVGKASTPVSRDIALQFIESVIYKNKEKGRQVLLNAVSRKGERLVPPSSLDSLMHAAFPSDSARTKATERFAEIYPLVKEIALGGSPRSKGTKPAAQQLLPLCLASASEDVGALYHEACYIMVWCLSQNADCYKQWEKLHLDHLKGSARVLEYLCSAWQENVQKLTPLEDLKRTIKAFRLKHEKAIERGNEDKDEDEDFEVLLRSAEKHCKSLQKKMSRGSTCKAIAVAIGFAGIAFGYYALNPNIDGRGWAGILMLSTQGS